MKKRNVWIAAIAAGLIMTGCGQGSVQETTVQETESQETATMAPVQSQETEETEEKETQAASSEAETQETIKIESAQEEKTESGNSSSQGSAASGYEDNFAVDSAAAAEFGQKVQDAVAQKDLEQLADLTAFPLYVGLNGGTSVNSREEFLDLGADQVFTQGLMDSVAAADLEQLSPSMAGFVLSDGGKANIIFSVRDGKLAVSGINY